MAASRDAQQQINLLLYKTYRLLKVSVKADSVDSGVESFCHGNVGVGLIIEQRVQINLKTVHRELELSSHLIYEPAIVIG